LKSPLLIKEKTVFYAEPDKVFGPDRPAAGRSKTGSVKKKPLYFLYRDTEKFLPPIVKGG
jgi:hypothetical protein